METTTSFDLDHAIQDWRETFAQSPAFRYGNLDELEAHLRDSIIVLKAGGLSEEESFMIAVGRIGTGQLLTAEYAKVNRSAIWLDRALWMLIGAQVCMVLASMYSVFRLMVIRFMGRVVEWIPGMTEPVYWIIMILLPPLLATITIVAGWKYFQRHPGKTQIPLSSLLRTPGRLAATSFLLCVGVNLATATANYWVNMPGFHKSPAMSWWIFAAGCIAALPEYAACAGLVYFFARKRLHLSKA